MGNGNIKVRTSTESFLLLHPTVGKSSHEVAMSIAACKGVNKVIITSGEVGFVISAVEDGSLSSEKVSQKVNRILGGRKVRIARGHYVYSRNP